MNDVFQPGQVWEMNYEGDDPNAFIFLLVERMPPQDNGPRFGVSSNTWTIIVLQSKAGIGLPAPGTLTRTQLDGVSFFRGDIGYDSYDNHYLRLA